LFYRKELFESILRYSVLKNFKKKIYSGMLNNSFISLVETITDFIKTKKKKGE